MSRVLKAHVFLVLITVIWGATFVVVKEALESVSPLLFNAIRMSLAAVFLGLVFRKHLFRLTGPAMREGLKIGFLLFLGYSLQTPGLHLTTPSKSAFLTGIYTMLVPLLLILIWKAHINHWRAIGFATACVGLFLMTVPSGQQGIADFAKMNRGDVLTIFCAVAFALHVIFVGRATQRFPFEQIATLQIAAAALFMAITTPVIERPHIQFSASVITAIVATGVLSTALGFTVQTWAQQFTPPTHTALIFTLEPVFAWLTSWLVLKERLGMRAGAGALLILAGVSMSELLGNVAKPMFVELAADQSYAGKEQ